LNIGEFRDTFLCPVINGYFAAGRTEPGFTGMGNFSGSAAGRADKLVESKFISSTGKDSFNVIMDIRAYKSRVLGLEYVPVVIVQEYLFD